MATSGTPERIAAKTGISVALLLALGGVAGCGGSDTKTVTQVRTQASAQPLTKPEYISQADAICKKYRSKLKPLLDRIAAQQITSPEDASKVADLLRQNADLLRSEGEQLEGLQKPPQDTDILRTILSDGGGLSSDLDGIAVAYNNYDLQDVDRRYRQADQDGAREHGLSQGYGFQVCGAD